MREVMVVEGEQRKRTMKRKRVWTRTRTQKDLECFAEHRSEDWL